MNDVSFNVDGIDFVYKDSLKYEKELNESVNGLADLAKLLEREVSSFRSFGQSAISEANNYMAEVRALISEVEGKKSSAESKKKSEISPPSPPSVPAKATPEEKQAIMAAHQQKVRQVEEMNRQIRQQNSKIDSYAKKCDGVISKLSEILSKITRLESMIRQETSRTESAAKNDLYAVKNAIRPLPSVCNAMGRFTYALSQTLESAKDLQNMKPSEIAPPPYADRLFMIQNRHTYIGPKSTGSIFRESSFSGIRSSFSSSADGLRSSSTTNPDESEIVDGILVTERDESDFIERIDGLASFKMPGANLHKLGGRAFVSKMKSLGYRVKPLPDGRITDADGIMYWVKNNE